MNPLDLVPSVQRAQGVTVDVAASASSGATARLLIDTALHFAAPVKDPSTKVEP